MQPPTKSTSRTPKPKRSGYLTGWPRFRRRLQPRCAGVARSVGSHAQSHGKSQRTWPQGLPLRIHGRRRLPGKRIRKCDLDSVLAQTLRINFRSGSGTPRWTRPCYRLRLQDCRYLQWRQRQRHCASLRNPAAVGADRHHRLRLAGNQDLRHDAGTVNAHGGPISNCRLQYTTEASFQKNGFAGAASNACVPNPEGTTNVSVSAKLSGLVAGTSYRFRVVATNNSGTAEATDSTFATLAETCATNPALCPPPPPEETPPAVVLPAPVLQLPASPTPPAKPLKCRKGFKKKRVHGKPKCVRIKKKQANRHAG